MSDRLHDTLSALRTDVDHMPLADSSAVRARGTQRTRRQAVGTSLAVVALVAGAVGISGALTGTNKASDLPADNPTVTTTQEEPSPDPSVDPRQVIGTDLLIGAKDLPSFPNQPFTTGETLEQATTADTEERGLAVCSSPPSGGVTPESAVLRTFVTDLDVRMWQWVAQYATAAEAQEAVDALSSTCARNGADPVDISTAPSMPAVDTALKSATFSADPDSEFNGSVAGIVRQGDVVVVLGLNGMLRETDVDMDAFDESVAQAAERLSIR
jgi:hypothetical protein